MLVERVLGTRQEHCALVLCVHTSLALYAFAYELRVIAYVFFNEELSGNAGSYAVFQSTFAVVQFVGGVAFGRFGDVAGGGLALIVSHVASATHYMLLSFVTTPLGATLALLPTLLQNGMQAAQLLVARASDPETRAIALGRLAIPYAVGGVVGSASSGYLIAGTGPRATIRLAALQELAMCAFICVFVPLRPPAGAGCAAACEAGPWVDLWRRRRVRDLLTTKLAVALASGLWTTMSAEYARSVFGLGRVELGWLVSLQLAAGVLTQGLAADAVNAAPVRTVLGAGCTLAAAALAALVVVPRSFVGLAACHVPLLCATYAADLALISQLSAAVPTSEIGTALGVEMAAGTIAGVLAPPVSAALMSARGFGCLVGVGAALQAAIGLTLFVRRGRELLLLPDARADGRPLNESSQDPSLGSEEESRRKRNDSYGRSMDRCARAYARLSREAAGGAPTVTTLGVGANDVLV